MPRCCRDRLMALLSQVRAARTPPVPNDAADRAALMLGRVDMKRTPPAPLRPRQVLGCSVRVPIDQCLRSTGLSRADAIVLGRCGA